MDEPDYMKTTQNPAGKKTRDEWLEETYNTQMKTIMVSKIITFKYNIPSQMITFFYQGVYTTIPFSQYGEWMDEKNLKMLTEYYDRLSDGTINHCQFLLKVRFPGSDEDRYFDCRLDAEDDESRRPVNILGVDIDITEQHLRTLAVEKANRQLEIERAEQEKKRNEIHKITRLALEAYGINIWKFDIKEQMFHSIMTSDDYFLDNKSFDEISQLLLPESISAYNQIRDELGNGLKDKDNAILGIYDKETDSKRYNRNAYTTIKDDNGNVTAIIGASKEITEELKQSHKLNLYQKKIEHMNASLNQVMLMGRIMPFVWQPQTDRFTVTSPEHRKNFDVFDENISSLSLSDVLTRIHPDDKEIVETALLKLKNGENDEANFTFRYDDYKNFNHTFSAVVRKLTYESDELTFIGFMQDVTEYNILTDTLLHEKLKAEESERLKSQFLANMSHEIRTPLNAIVGFSDLLGETDSKEEQKEFIDIIKKNNNLLLDLIDNIIELSKLEAGHSKRTVSNFDFAGLIRQAYITDKQLNTNPDVEILCDMPVDKAMVTLDKTRVAEVINNFMSNAMKYTKKGHIKLGFIQPSEHSIRLYVEDTGIGMKKSDADHVFERFEKLGSFIQGAGLGMAICKAYLKDAGGRIGVKSKEGKGSTFWAEYPI